MHLINIKLSQFIPACSAPQSVRGNETVDVQEEQTSWRSSRHRFSAPHCWASLITGKYLNPRKSMFLGHRPPISSDPSFHCKGTTFTYLIYYLIDRTCSTLLVTLFSSLWIFHVYIRIRASVPLAKLWLPASNRLNYLAASIICSHE